MNWMSSVKNKVKNKLENQKQLEYFERQRLAKRMKMTAPEGEESTAAGTLAASSEKAKTQGFPELSSGKPKLSLDILSLHQVPPEREVPDESLEGNDTSGEEDDSGSDQDRKHEGKPVIRQTGKQAQRKAGIQVVPLRSSLSGAALGLRGNPLPAGGLGLKRDQNKEAKDLPEQSKKANGGIKFFNDRKEVTASDPSSSLKNAEGSPDADLWSMHNGGPSSRHSVYSSALSSHPKGEDDNPSVGEDDDDGGKGREERQRENKWEVFLGEPVFEAPTTPVKETPPPVSKVTSKNFFKRQGKGDKRGAKRGSRKLTPMVLVPVEKDENDGAEEEEEEEDREAAKAREQEFAEIRGELGLFDAKLSAVTKDLLLLKEEVDRIRERQAARDWAPPQGPVDGQVTLVAASEAPSEEVVPPPPVEIVGENLFRPQQRDSEVIPLNKTIHPLIPFSF